MGNVMAKWIRKINHDFTADRVSIPSVLIHRLGWESCRYVTVEKGLGEYLIIRRMIGDDSKRSCGTKHFAEID